MRRLRCRSGFTLVETLIAMALLAVVLASIYGTFFLSHRAVKSVDETVLKLHEGRTALDIICRELEGAFFSKSQKNSLFRVEDREIYGRRASRIYFTAFSPQMPGPSAISYKVEDKEGRLTLVKELSPLSAGGTPAQADIMEDIEGFYIETKTADAWVGTWDAKDGGKIPDEIRVTLKCKKFSLSQTIRPKIGRPV